MCLSTIGMDHICDYLERAYYLEDLDISFNNFRSHSFRRFMQILSKNRTLKTLNLSMNPILPFTDSREAGDYEIKTREERLQEGILKLLTNKGLPAEDPLEGNDHTELVLEALSRFIRHNNVLQHIDLMNTGLSERVITGIARPLRHAKSLLSAHIGMNPGITVKSKDFLRERLRC